MTHEPPATVTRQWCPECGRTAVEAIPSLPGHLPPPADPGEWNAGLCGGTVQTLTYDLRNPARAAMGHCTGHEVATAGCVSCAAADIQLRRATGARP